MIPAYLIVDIGTGNIRAGIVDTKGRILSTSTADAGYDRDPGFADSSTFAPDMWMDAIFGLAKQALAGCGPVDIIAVSSTSQREGIVLLDSRGEAFLGLPNIDNRGAGYIESIPDLHRVQELTGFDLIPSFSAAKLIGTRAVQPEAMDRISRYTSVSDWVGYELTGNLVWEKSQAMHSMVYDYVKECWSGELCELFGFERSWHPELVQWATPVGKVKADICIELGLNPDAVFVTGGADTQLALVGLQAKPGDVSIIAGTTSPIEKLFNYIPPQKGGWLNPHALPGQYMLEVNAAYTGINLQIFKNMFFPESGFDELEQQARKRGLPQCMAMMGMGINMPGGPVTNGGFLMPNPIPHDMAGVDFVHAIMLDIACGIGQCLSYLDEITGAADTPLIGCGGVFNGILTPQYIADLTGNDIIVYEGYRQASMLGCARACGEALGKEPFARKTLRIVNAKQNPELQDYYSKWLRYREALRNV